MESITLPLGTRTEALRWWNEMCSHDRFNKLCEYEDLIVDGSTRKWYSLTGREVEIIYLADKKENK